MTLARRNVENPGPQDRALNGVAKLSRTFATLRDTLKPHQHGGEQTVTVQHVNDGGHRLREAYAGSGNPGPCQAA